MSMFSRVFLFSLLPPFLKYLPKVGLLQEKGFLMRRQWNLWCIHLHCCPQIKASLIIQHGMRPLTCKMPAPNHPTTETAGHHFEKTCVHGPFCSSVMMLFYVLNQLWVIYKYHFSAHCALPDQEVHLGIRPDAGYVRSSFLVKDKVHTKNSFSSCVSP